MKLKIVVHKAEEGGFWAEVPALAGCFSQGESMEELTANIHEAIEGWLSVEPEKIQLAPEDEVLEIAV